MIATIATRKVCLVASSEGKNNKQTQQKKTRKESFETGLLVVRFGVYHSSSGTTYSVYSIFKMTRFKRPRKIPFRVEAANNDQT